MFYCTYAISVLLPCPCAYNMCRMSFDVACACECVPLQISLLVLFSLQMTEGSLEVKLPTIYDNTDR